jgi:peptidyl-tRNA hydrolase, PTH1 family
MKLIVGLGNPGEQYERTRHNAGFLVLDRLARRHAAGAAARGRFHGATLDATIDSVKVLLLKPTTYMNRTGLSVAEAIRFYKVNPESDLLVLVDDVALPTGSIRLRAEGGAGGHNGLIDVEEKLGTTKYARLRIGIDKPGRIPQAEYVLGRFTDEQLERLEPALDEATEAAACWARDGIIVSMNRYNRKDTAEAAQQQQT